MSPNSTSEREFSSSHGAALIFRQPDCQRADLNHPLVVPVQGMMPADCWGCEWVDLCFLIHALVIKIFHLSFALYLLLLHFA